ncbi:hypothetical protein C8R45DRAFT_942366 [Mycena sanguinolenta]|nr:hypothetical protein C8R45DRAFT_942366 [Mycena sanguinolenta]
MCNRTIVDMGDLSSARYVRDGTSNAILIAQWQNEVEFFENNTRVPSLEYLRTVPRLKPMGSAVTSVFVSTFAMLSVTLTVFSLLAGARARAHRDDAPRGTHGAKHSLGQSRTMDTWSESEVDGSESILSRHPTEPDAVERWRQKIDSEAVQMRVALARMSAALKNHGILEDKNWDEDLVVE